MALFQTWNYNFFASSFIMGRTRLMQMSRIGSKTTFAKVLRDLHDFGYITYKPSGYTAMKPTITMLIFHEMDSPCPTTVTAPVQDMNNPCPDNGTDPVPEVGYIDKQMQTNVNNAISVCVPHTPHPKNKKVVPPAKEEVIRWFTEKQISLDTGSAFYHHYKAIGWKIGKNRIVEWQDAAEKWIINSKKVTNHGSSEYLHTDNYKNYGEPL
jgi:hypothetical protein